MHSGATGALIRSIPGANGVLRVGFSLANAGDVDLDGFDDLVSGSPGLPSYPGRAPIYSTATGALLGDVAGCCFLNVDHDFGFTVAGGVDVDLDGRPDFAVGSHAMNLARVYSSATGALLYEVQEPSSSQDEEGIEVALLPDISGDGRGELAFGHQADATAAFYPGRAAVYAQGRSPIRARSATATGARAPAPARTPGRAARRARTRPAAARS